MISKDSKELRQTEFDYLLKRIINKTTALNSDELIPFLSVSSKSERINVNKRIAEVYVDLKEFASAKVFVDRAWLLSQFSETILPLYLQVHEALQDYISIREAYKRIGTEQANKGKIHSAISFFNLWQYTFANYEKTDKYAYDFDILYAIERLAIPYCANISKRNLKSSKAKIRVAHIIYSWAPALHKIDYSIAEFLDKSRFELVFVIPDQIHQNPNHASFINKINAFDCSVITADLQDPLQQSLEIVKKIEKFKPDILFNSAALADFWIYFITLLSSAPLKVALIGGALPLYITPIFDVGMVESYHITMDCLIDCERIELALPLPSIESNQALNRSVFNIPEKSVLLVTGGRPSKFQNKNYWETIGNILSENINNYLVVVGTLKNDIVFIDDIISNEVLSRIRFLPSRKDYLSVYTLADVALDTFPQSGGIMIIETMALGIPLITFDNDFFKLYDQVTMCLAREFCGIPELIVPHGDFEEFKKVVIKLIDNVEYRNKMGRICSDKAHSSRGNPGKLVKQIENIYLKLINEKLLIQTASKSINNEGSDVFKNFKVKPLIFHFFRSLYLRSLQKIG